MFFGWSWSRGNPKAGRRKAGNSMTRWIKCPGCDGEVGVPDSYEQSTVECPKCSATVAVDPTEGIQWRPSRPVDSPSVDATQRSEDEQDKDDDAGSAGVSTVPYGRKKTVPGWYSSAGMVAMALAVMGGVASATVGSGGTSEGAIAAVALNPFVFIGGPLGCYWLLQWKRWSSGRSLLCPHCGEFIDSDVSRGDIIPCWNCRKRLRKP